MMVDCGDLTRLDVYRIVYFSAKDMLLKIVPDMGEDRASRYANIHAVKATEGTWRHRDKLCVMLREAGAFVDALKKDKEW